MNQDIQNRMKSIRQTVQISSAQKVIAASSIGRARRMLESSRPYHNRIRKAISEALACCPEDTSRYFTERPVEQGRRGVLILAANKGLSGGYGGNLIRFATESLRRDPATHLAVLGRLGAAQMTQQGFTIDPKFNHPLDPPSLFTARELAEELTQLFEADKADYYDVIYTEFISTVRLRPVETRLFPLSPSLFPLPFAPRVQQGNMIFEPEPEVVLQSLLLKYTKGFLYGCLVHAWVSELASRMTAMDSAVRNGNEMLDALSLEFNRSRQAGITQEITEIVAGATAMSSRD